MIIYLLLIIPLFLISCKKEDNDIPISLNTVDINAINNNKLLQIIDDDSLDGGIYLIQTKSNQYVYFNGNKIGEVTSGSIAPSLNKNIGLGYILEENNLQISDKIQILIRNKLYNAEIVKIPFVKKRYKK